MPPVTEELQANRRYTTDQFSKL